MLIRSAALDDLVQLATIEPNPSAAWAVINFNTLALHHQKRCISTARTFHFIHRLKRSPQDGTIKSIPSHIHKKFRHPISKRPIYCELHAFH